MKDSAMLDSHRQYRVQFRGCPAVSVHAENPGQARSRAQAHLLQSMWPHLEGQLPSHHHILPLESIEEHQEACK